MAIDNKQLARRFFDEVWNRGRLEAIDELVDASYEGRDPIIGLNKRDGLREAVKSYRAAFPDMKFEIVNVLGDGNFVCTRWTVRGTHQGPFMGMEPTGKVAVVTGIDVGEYRNGKLISDVSEYDALGMLRQLGLDTVAMPLPGRRATVKTEKRT